MWIGHSKNVKTLPLTVICPQFRRKHTSVGYWSDSALFTKRPFHAVAPITHQETFCGLFKKDALGRSNGGWLIKQRLCFWLFHWREQRWILGAFHSLIRILFWERMWIPQGPLKFRHVLLRMEYKCIKNFNPAIWWITNKNQCFGSISLAETTVTPAGEL